MNFIKIGDERGKFAEIFKIHDEICEFFRSYIYTCVVYLNKETTIIFFYSQQTHMVIEVGK